MAHPYQPARAWLHRLVTPGLAYRLARWRRPTAIGSGRLVTRAAGRGAARLHYSGDTGDESRAGCLRRQSWALRVLTSCGASHAILTEQSCLARGDAGCEYVLTWTEDARLAPAALAGLLAAAALAPTPFAADAPVVWLIVPAVGVVSYSLERWRVGRANPIAAAQAAAAFRWLIEQALGSRQTPAAGPADRTPVRDPGVSIEQAGDGWQVGYQGVTVVLRPSRGLALLVHLLRNPGQEIHVSALDAITPAGGSGARPAFEGGIVPGDAGEILDARARQEYRRRLADLREELEDAQARHDTGRAEVIRAELELLEDELRSAVGPGGRVRRVVPDAERLRVAITHRIRAAIAQITRCHPALGAHLQASISTGYRCRYEPAEEPAVSATPARQPERKA